MRRVFKSKSRTLGRPRLDQQIYRLHALHRIGSIINATFDLTIILGAICESLTRDFDFEKSGIVFLDDASLKPLRSAHAGFTAAEYRHLLDQLETLLLPVLQKEDICLRTAAHASSDWMEMLETLGARSLLLLPLRVKSNLIGFIVGSRARGAFLLNESGRQIYSMFAAQASTAVENARLYEALGQANRSLEEKVAERTTSLIEANERLRELDQVKSNFISLVSHELRTPLTAIKGFAVTLYQYDKEITNEKRQVYLRVLNEETDRLTRLIIELLDISHIESGRIDIQWRPVSVPQIARRVFQTFGAKAGSIRLVDRFPGDFPELMADPGKLEQVLTSLVDNALRFSPPGGVITVSGYPSDKGVTLEVKDQGVGIAFSEQEKIFDKFYRLDNEINHRIPGTGLGLSICRALINVHGGKIWVESEENHGCRFIVHLPLNLDKKAEEAFLDRNLERSGV